ncbi:MAG: hypothetical protein JW893_04635 [Candidatus Omnitrophica bacterium]|nr:hypothetical protein [Candidatus Omnitrophota bacterium]
MTRSGLLNEIKPPKVSAIFMIVLLMGLQIIFVVKVFPVQKLDLQTPILTHDMAFHHYQTQQALYLLKHFGKTWGYDPFYMAGYPTAVVNMTDNFGAAFAVGFLAFFLPLALAEKVFLLGIMILFPVWIFWAAKNFGCSDQESFLSGIIVTLVLQHHPFYVSMMNWGLYSFVLAAAFSVCCFSLIVRFVERQDNRAWLWMTILGSYLVSVHPLSVPLLFLFLIPYLILSKEACQFNNLIRITASFLVMFFMNLYWILPLLKASPLYKHVPTYVQAFGIEQWMADVKDLKLVLFHVFALIGVMAPIFVCKSEKTSRNWVLSLGTAFMIFYGLSYFGFYGPFKYSLAHIEPGRFIVVAIFVIPLLSAVTLSEIARSHIRKMNILLIAFVFLSQLFCLYSAGKIKKGDFIYQKCDLLFCSSYREHSRWGDDVMAEGGQALVDAIKQYTDSSARILLEDHTWAWAYWESRLPALLAGLTGREYIGGPLNLRIQHQFAHFEIGKLFGRSILSLPVAKFLDYVRLYNIGWAVIHSDEAKMYVRRHPKRFTYLTSLQGAYGIRFDLYRIANHESYFVKGEGKIERVGWNEIVLSNLSKGPVVIKYHYFEGLKTDPKVEISRVEVLDDPIGFISLDNSKGYARIRITT